MKLDEWRHVQDTEPATPNQVGAIHHEFERLGFGEADRAERLAITAALAGLDEVESTTDLTMGEAGHLVRLLADASDRGDLPLIRSQRGDLVHHAEVTPLLEALRTVLVQLYAPAARLATPTTPEVNT